MLQVTDLAVDFRVEGLRWFGGGRRGVRAVDGVTLMVRNGETLGIVGESGSGKTTLARAILRLIAPTEGSIRYKGRDIAVLRGAELAWFRRQVQIVFQDPYESLNPAFTIGRSIEEPLRVLTTASRSERRDRMHAALRRVGLMPPGEYLDAYPHQLSGGQLQRVAIARALVVGPSLLIADEPVSMLDVSIRAGIMAVLESLVRETQLACLYISHDLALIRYLCERTLVMHRGKVVEEGPTEVVIRHPSHPYSAALVHAAPRMDDGMPEPLAVLTRERNTMARGCRFYARCPAAFEPCDSIAPAMEVVGPGGHAARCHLHSPAYQERERMQRGV
jgi:oligopeptide/dipeptide ABC transporter ATP-binding protein